MSIKLTARHPIVTWMVDNAAHLRKRFELGHDGKTAHELEKGRLRRGWASNLARPFLVEAEKVCGGALATMACLWEDGIYVGFEGTSGEVIVADASHEKASGRQVGGPHR